LTEPFSGPLAYLTTSWLPSRTQNTAHLGQAVLIAV